MVSEKVSEKSGNNDFNFFVKTRLFYEPFGE